MGENQDNLAEHEAVQAFAGCARKYCTLVESHKSLEAREFIIRAAPLLAELYKCALELPDVEPETDDPIGKEVGHECWAALYSEIGSKLGKWDTYRTIFDPYDYDEDEEIFGGLSGDFADIYCDFKDGLTFFDSSSGPGIQEAVWQWKNAFRFHTGNHITSALRALHWLIYRDPFDEQE